MGDASQASLKSSPQRHTSPDTPDPQSVPPQNEREDQIDDLLKRVSVLYSHSVEPAPKDFPLESCVVCHSFDALLLLLEDDQVDELWFDETVSAHESSYILGWARIFRPDLHAQKLQRHRFAN
ncbi:MAG: hypothetical protein RIR26_545 [Pseudomonadota bacterium]|jgi:hypothetical protein